MQTLARFGGWGLLVIGLVALLVASWKGVIVGGAEHQRALAREQSWRELSEKQRERFDVLQEAIESVQESMEEIRTSQRTVESVLRASPRGSRGR